MKSETCLTVSPVVRASVLNLVSAWCHRSGGDRPSSGGCHMSSSVCAAGSAGLSELKDQRTKSKGAMFGRIAYVMVLWAYSAPKSLPGSLL